MRLLAVTKGSVDASSCMPRMHPQLHGCICHWMGVFEGAQSLEVRSSKGPKGDAKHSEAQFWGTHRKI